MLVADLYENTPRLVTLKPEQAALVDVPLVVVAEADPSLRRELVQRLRDEGCLAVAVATAAELERAVASTPTEDATYYRPDIVLADTRLLVSSVLSTLELLRNDWLAPLVVCLATTCDAAAVQLADRAGAVSIMSTPPDILKLLAWCEFAVAA